MQVARRSTLAGRNPIVRFTDSKRVLTKIYDSVHGANIWCHVRNFAASVPSEASEPVRRQRRLSKDERHAMVISFIDKYRAENLGKFPTPSIARKNLGGSYYVIRQIIQELEYKSKVSATNKMKENIQKKEVEAAGLESLTKVEEISESTMGFTPCEHKSGIHEDTQTMIKTMNDGVISKHFDAKEGPQASTRVEEVLSIENMKLECKEVIHTHPEKHEDSEKERTATKGLQDSKGPRGEVVQGNTHALDSDKFKRVIVRKENEEDELQNRPTIWRNLKSIADGFMNFWRKK